MGFKKGHKHGFKKGCIPWNKGRKGRQRNHNTSGLMPFPKGNKLSWKGGRIKTLEGYIRVWSTTQQKYIFEHRMVMEKHIRRELEEWEQVHHKNSIKDDNRIENLEIVIRKEHYGKIRCPYCLE